MTRLVDIACMYDFAYFWTELLYTSSNFTGECGNIFEARWWVSSTVHLN